VSNIEWTDATWNPVVGCSRVSAGCDHCYAVGMTRRLEGMSKAGGFGLTGHRAENYRGLTIELPQAAVDRGCGVNGRHFNGEVRCVEEALEIPLRWKRPQRIFVNSMSDLFHPKVPFEFIDKVFAVMALSEQHTFQVLTKRPERMADYFAHCHARIVRAIDLLISNTPRSRRTPDRWMSLGVPVAKKERWPLPNVWLGTSCENQAAADERIPHLLECPAAVRFLSCEPLLGPIDLYNYRRDWLRPLRSMFSERPPIQPGIDWVIVGGESGTQARPCDIQWIRSIVLDCANSSVACFVKQLGTNSRALAPWWPSNIRADYDGANGEFVARFTDRKGADPSEWPADLRVQQMPVGGAD
jgi:protein gp37